MQRIGSTQRSKLWPLAIVLPATTLFIISCFDRDSTTSLDDPSAITGFMFPSAAQICLDLPTSLAPAAAAAVSASMLSPQAGEPPCENEEFPGGTYACVTRHLFGRMAVGCADAVVDLTVEVTATLSLENVPQNMTIGFTRDDFLIRVWWRRISNGAEYRLDIFDRVTEDQYGHWEWTIDNGGGARGEYTMLKAAIGAEDAPDAVRFAFDSNADGSEKAINMDLDLWETPPLEDPSAPTKLKLEAERSPTQWTVQYGMYHPTWLVPEVEGGVEAIILVTAVSGIEKSSPAVMNIIALDGGTASIPRNAEDDHALCDFLAPLLNGTGDIPPGAITCGDNNPYYIASDGAVQEGGAAPAGLEGLAAALSALGYVVGAPGSIQNLEVSF